MAFLPVYEHDIFISCFSFNDSSPSAPAVTWAEQFYKNLNLMLARKAGSLGIVDVCFQADKDGEFKRNRTDANNDIQRSALFLCLDGGAYAASEDGKNELEIFSKKAGSESAGLKVGGRSRIVHVLLHNIPSEKWPAALTGTRAFKFFQSNGDTTDSTSEEYKTAMHELVDYLWQLLNDFLNEENLLTEQPATQPGENGELLTVYLGEVADSRRIPRNRVIAELKSKGIKVVTDATASSNLAGMEQTTRALLNKADFAVHLLDESPGEEIKDQPGQWKIQKQTEWVLGSGMPQMIWVPAEINFENIKETGYKEFLQSIEKGSVSSNDYEYVRGNKSTLTHDIIDFAAQVKVLQKQNKSRNGKVSVMLDTHFCDQLYAIDLAKTLLENNIQPYINPQEDDPGKNIYVMGERLSQVNKLIFLYGHVSKEWLRERMNAALELIITNHYPIREFYVYMAPPLKETNNLFIHQQFLNVHVINNSKNAVMNKNELQDFLKALNTPQE